MRRRDDHNDQQVGWLTWLQGQLAERGYDVTTDRGGKARLANDAGIAPSSVSRILSGKVPDYDLQIVLARFLGVSLDEMLIRTGKAAKSDFHHPRIESGQDEVSSEKPLTPEELAALAGVPRDDRDWFVTMVRRLRKQGDAHGSAAGGAAAEG